MPPGNLLGAHENLSSRRTRTLGLATAINRTKSMPHPCTHTLSIQPLITSSTHPSFHSSIDTSSSKNIIIHRRGSFSLFVHSLFVCIQTPSVILHSFIHSFTFIHSFIHSIIRSTRILVTPFVSKSFQPLLAHSFLHSFIHSFIHSTIHSFNHSFIHSFIHSFTHSFLHSFVHSFIHSLILSHSFSLKF